MSELSDKEMLIMMTTKCADLEKQLEEAREEIQDLRNIGNFFNEYVPPNLRDLYNEQLKEKG